MNTTRFPRFSLRQFLLAICLISGLLSFVLIAVDSARHRYSRVAYDEVRCLAFSPDGNKLAVVHRKAYDANVPFKHYVADVSRSIAIFDVANLSECEIVQYELRPGNQGPMIGFSDSSASIAFSADSKHLFILDWGGAKIRKSTIQSHDSLEVAVVEESQIYGFVLSANGELLAARHRNGVGIWNIHAAQRVFSISEGWPFSFSRDSKWLAINGREALEIWNVEEKKLVRTIHQNHDSLDRVTCVAFSDDGETIAVGCNDGLRLYSIATVTEQAVIQEHLEVQRDDRQRRMTTRSPNNTIGVAFSPDGKWLAAWGEYGLKLFEIDNGCKLLRTVSDPAITCLAFSPDSTSYATGDRNGKVTLWDAATGNEIRSTVLRGKAGKN